MKNGTGQYVKIRNFETFQHYKNRCPPWIKLYARLWRDRNFQRLADEHKAHLIGLFSLASHHENRLLWDEEWLGRELVTTSPINLQALVNSGFIIPIKRKHDASAALADCTQEPIAETYKEETYKEEERRTPLPPSGVAARPVAVRPKGPPKSSQSFEEFWLAFPRKVDRPKSERAWRKHNCDSIAPAVMTGLSTWKESVQWTKDGGEFITYPATWLNRRGWEDPVKTETEEDRSWLYTAEEYDDARKKLKR